MEEIINTCFRVEHTLYLIDKDPTGLCMHCNPNLSSMYTWSVRPMIKKEKVYYHNRNFQGAEDSFYFGRPHWKATAAGL